MYTKSIMGRGEKSWDFKSCLFYSRYFNAIVLTFTNKEVLRKEECSNRSCQKGLIQEAFKIKLNLKRFFYDSKKSKITDFLKRIRPLHSGFYRRKFNPLKSPECWQCGQFLEWIVVELTFLTGQMSGNYLVYLILRSCLSFDNWLIDCWQVRSI